MSIEFDTYDGGSQIGSLRAVLPAPSGLFTPVATVGLRAVLPTAVGRFVGAPDAVSPSYVGFDGSLTTPQAQFLGYYTATGSLDASLPQPASSFYDGPRMRAVIDSPVSLFTTATPASLFSQLYFDLLIGAEYDAPQINDVMQVDDARLSEWAIVLTEILNMTDVPSTWASLAATLTDSIVAQDIFTIVFQGVATDEIEFDETLEATLRMVYLLADELMLEDPAVGYYNALVLVTSALVLGDDVTIGLDGRLTDEIALTDELLARINAIVQLADELAAEDALTTQLVLFSILDDAIEVEDDPAALLALLTELLDTVGLSVHLTDQDGDTFIGYSVNIKVGAVSEYENYPFNSMAVIGGLPFGASSDGVFLLQGDDDAGDPIRAGVYTGLTDFGSSFLKQLPAAWIGLTSDGEMVLKTVTTDKGKKQENWYRMKARPKGTPVDSRFSPAKGLEGRYWGFKLENIDGANFQIDSLKVWPLVMKRRYSGR